MSGRGNILVTGGAGYVGSHACKALAEAGYTPVAYDNLVSGHERAVQWGPLETGDIGDQDRLSQVIGRYLPEAVMHFAAFINVGESTLDPARYYANNVQATMRLLEMVRHFTIRHFVFSSTAAVYGIPYTGLITEASPLQPISVYGRSKLMVEQMLADFGAAYGFNWTALRYFNAAGADPDNQIGEDHEPETHLIPLVLDAASGRRDAITVFGTDYDTPDGTCIRDYIHVTDLADAHVKALDALRAGGESGAFNLGNGRGYSVNEVIETAERVTGLRVARAYGERRPGDPASLVADTARARDRLGWKPRFAELETIIATAWAWHQYEPAETHGVA